MCKHKNKSMLLNNNKTDVNGNCGDDIQTT